MKKIILEFSLLKYKILRMKNWLRYRLNSRWLLRRCMDCGVPLDRTYDRGDVCKKCFDDFDGMTLEEICEGGL